MVKTTTGRDGTSEQGTVARPDCESTDALLPSDVMSAWTASWQSYIAG